MADVHDLRLKHLQHLVQKLEHQSVRLGIGGAIGVGIGIVAALGQLGMGAEDVVGMAQRGLLGNDLQIPRAAVVHQSAHRLLRENAAAGVFKMDGVLVPRAAVLHVVGALRIGGHVPTVGLPRLVDLRMALVFHAAAQLQQNRVDAIAAGEVDDSAEFVQPMLVRQVQLQTAERAPGRALDLAHGRQAAAFARHLPEQMAGVQRRAQPPGRDAQPPAVGANAEAVVRAVAARPFHDLNALRPPGNFRKRLVEHGDSQRVLPCSQRREALDAAAGNEQFLHIIYLLRYD